MRSAAEGDPLDALASLLGITRRELVAAIVRASHRDWMRQLRRVLKEQEELPDEEVNLWDPDAPEPRR